MSRLLGDVIRIYRITDNESLAADFSPGSAIRAVDLNNNFKQSNYVAQETTNYSVQDLGNVTLSANYAFTGIAAGQTPTANNHFATKQYVDTVVLAGIPVGDKGDITVSSAGATWTIDNKAVTYNKIQDISATDVILGRSSAGSGSIEEIVCTSTARSLLSNTSTTAMRTTLGVAIGSDVQGYDPNTAKTNVAQSFSAPQRGTLTTVSISSGAITVNLGTTNNFYLNLNANVTSVTLSGATAGQSGTIFIKQSGTYTLGGWPATAKFSGGAAPSITTVSGKYDRIDYVVYDANNIQMVWSGNY